MNTCIHTYIYIYIIKTWRTPRETLLTNIDEEPTDNKLLVFITTYDPSQNPLTKVVKKNWDILSRNTSTRWLYDTNFKMGLRRLPNLCDLLVKAKLSSRSETKAPIRPNRYKNQNCRYCPKINTDGTMPSPFHNKSWTTKNQCKLLQPQSGICYTMQIMPSDLCWTDGTKYKNQI